MEQKKQNDKSIQPVVTPQPVVIVPSKQYDVRNFRHYSTIHQFMPPGGDFTLDMNLQNDSYMELVKFEIETVLIQDTVQGLTLPNEYFLGDCRLEIRRLLNGVESGSLGIIPVSMKKDVIENKHLIWDQAAYSQIRFYINTATFEAYRNGIIFPAYNATIDSIKVILRFTFCDYPKQLYQFNQNPVLSI